MSDDWIHTDEVPKIIRWYMKWRGYRGLTCFWGKVYYIDEISLSDGKLFRHESKHIEQMNRDGILKFHILYAYYWIRYGYEFNPYEIEARRAEDE